ncbi:MAG: hypothetical protein JNK59_13310 [Sterolibacteriaceae bacterium]|uniref:hypothetical protein n=1 Tax=Sulfuritalea sp. TaxID=2480090 RepID=UPI001A52CE06|nr:hypothetical protein [Sulfuritalea sp.]MBL8480279.1 hypothetical protein [Sterolibacteriaceae bacterium]MBN8473481.1 hypothetical protein [Sulfuritalea sp.]
MKKLIIALCLGVASSASMAATVCAAGTATAVASSTTDFVRTGFTPRCSANTQADFQQNANSAAVGAASAKGNQSFGGHSNGGAVEKVADSASGYADVAAALTAAAAAATAKLAAAGSS